MKISANSSVIVCYTEIIRRRRKKNRKNKETINVSNKQVICFIYFFRFCLSNERRSNATTISSKVYLLSIKEKKRVRKIVFCPSIIFPIIELSLHRVYMQLAIHTFNKS